MHWIIETAREFQKNIYFCFTDYAKAFDCVDHHKLWKILQETGIPDHLTCLLRNLYRLQQLWRMGLVALWHVEPSWTRDQTCVPCIGRRIPIHCTTGEVLIFHSSSFHWRQWCGNAHCRIQETCHLPLTTYLPLDPAEGKQGWSPLWQGYFYHKFRSHVPSIPVSAKNRELNITTEAK